MLKSDRKIKKKGTEKNKELKRELHLQLHDAEMGFLDISPSKMRQIQEFIQHGQPLALPSSPKPPKPSLVGSSEGSTSTARQDEEKTSAAAVANINGLLLPNELLREIVMSLRVKVLIRVAPVCKVMRIYAEEWAVSCLSTQMEVLQTEVRKRTKDKIHMCFFVILRDEKEERDRKKQFTVVQIDQSWEFVVANLKEEKNTFHFFHNKSANDRKCHWKLPDELSTNTLARWLSMDLPRNAFYSAPLRKVFLHQQSEFGKRAEVDDDDDQHLIDAGRRLEKQLCNEFDALKGKSVCFYCYLLMDPTLMEAGEADEPESRFATFVRSIFYVGKGTQLRVYAHLTDFVKSIQPTKNRPKTPELSAKYDRIKEIWSRNKGVIAILPFVNMPEQEAFIRESSLIVALGLKNLTNQVGGHDGAEKLSRKHDGVWNTRWQDEKNRMELGTALLWIAYRQMEFSRLRPLLREDAEAMSKLEEFSQTFPDELSDKLASTSSSSSINNKPPSSATAAAGFRKQKGRKCKKRGRGGHGN